MSESVEDDKAKFNPKVHRTCKTGGKKAMAFEFADVCNPISLEIKDPEEVAEMFKKWPIIPFSATGDQSMHGLLYFLNASRFISPTLGACHESIKTYVFSGKMDIRLQQDTTFVFEGEKETEIGLETKKNYSEFISTLDLGELSLTQLGHNLYDSFKSNGNYWLEIIHTETAGVRQTSIKYHPTENCGFWATKPGKNKIVVISPVWTDEYLRKHKPKMVPLYPQYVKNGSTTRTIIHVKHGNFKWYGRPDWIGAWIQAYREYQDSDYLTKAAANRFTGEVFIELEEDDVENDNLLDEEEAVSAGFDSVTDRIESNFTAKGDNPQTIMVTTRPHGARPAFIYQFRPVTNENFFRTSSEINRQKIIENNQWSERLLGNCVREGFSQDSFVSELKTKEISILRYYKDRLEYGINIALQEAVKFQERKEFLGLTAFYKSVFDSLTNVPGAQTETRTLIDSYGIAVRAGAVTPNLEDENFFRELLGIQEINEYTAKAWAEDGNYRRPVTIKGSEDSKSEKNKRDDGPT